MYECKQCGKEFNKKSGIANHVRWYHKNQGSIIQCANCNKMFNDITGKISHQRYCGKDTVKQTYQQMYGEERALQLKTKISKAQKGKPWKCKTLQGQTERRKKISHSMKKNPKSGGYRVGSGIGKGAWYQSQIAGRVYLDSSYQLAYARWLDDNGIIWKRNTTKFVYQYQGTIKYYIPDFYLVNTDQYIEIKGYKTKKDLAKWENFPHKLTILMLKQLREMRIL